MWKEIAMKRWIIVMVLMLCGMALVSCRSLKPSSAGIMVESYPQLKIKANSRMFDDHFRVVDSACAKNDAGRLKATVSVENLKEDCQFQYRYRWIDKDGIEVKSPTTVWEPASAGSREVKLLSGVAPELKVEDFILDVRFSYGSTRW
jgi:uncharacterized protein YcfL